MSVDPLEAVADAIQLFEGWKPGTRSYKNRSPGNLRIPGMKADDKGYTVYPSFVIGYQALLAELRDKFSGNNKHGIGPDSTLSDLMNIYAPPSDDNPTTKYTLFVASWVGQALGRVMTPDTKLREIWSGDS